MTLELGELDGEARAMGATSIVKAVGDMRHAHQICVRFPARKGDQDNEQFVGDQLMCEPECSVSSSHQGDQQSDNSSHQGDEQSAGEWPQSAGERRRRSLKTCISKHVLRGVRLEVALRRFGTHWSGTIGGGIKTNAVDYYLSEQVDRINDFLSHDWETRRWPKFLTLCLLYNATPAYTASILVGLLLSILQLESVRLLPKLDEPIIEANQVGPNGLWCLPLCTATFVFVLLFWQRLRQIMRCNSRVVFVDKLCIHQTDNELKLQGVCGLAGFINHSERLVVIWGPRYFKRLWCMYEVASWLFLNKDVEESVLFMPVALTQLISVLFVGLLVFYSIFRFNVYIPAPFSLPLIISAIFFVTIVPVHIWRRLIYDLRILPLQLAEFSSREAECFCCTNAHVHPETGMPLLCDRELVYDTFKDWFPSDSTKEAPDAGDEAYLHAFDHHVRTKFSQAVLSQVGGGRLRYRDVLLACLPMLWFGFDTSASFAVSQPGPLIRRFTQFLLLQAASLPIALKLMLAILLRFDEALGVPDSRVLDVGMSVFLGFVFLMIILFLWLPNHLLSSRDEAWPQVAFSCSQAVGVWFLYRSSCICRMRAVGS